MFLSPFPSQYADGVLPIVIAASDAPEIWKLIAGPRYVCDGSNDQVDFRTAIAELGALGGKIIVSPGNFSFSLDGIGTGCVDIDQTIGPLVIEGSWESRIKVADDVPDRAMLFYMVGGGDLSKRTSPTILSGLYFDGNNPTGTHTASVAEIQASYADNITIQGCYFTSPRIQSIHLGLHSQNFKIVNNTFDATCGNTAIRIESQDGTINGNKITSIVGTAYPAIAISPNTDIADASRNIDIFNNLILNPFIGVALTGCYHINVHANLISGATGTSGAAAAVAFQSYHSGLYGTDWPIYENVISENIIYDCARGICLFSSNSSAALYDMRNTIQANKIIEGPSCDLVVGISETNTYSDYNNILFNDIYNATTEISTVGTHDVVRKVGEGVVTTDTDGAVIQAVKQIKTAVTALTHTEGQFQWDSTWKTIRVWDSAMEKMTTPIGWLPSAYSLGQIPSSGATTAVSLPSGGGSFAFPVFIPSHMQLQKASIRNLDTTLERSWLWHIYVEDMNVVAGDKLLRALGSSVTGTFTAVAASNQGLNLATAPLYLPPGLYWIVIQNIHATNPFSLGTIAPAAGAVIGNTGQTKVLSIPPGDPLDFILATWSKNSNVVGCFLSGRVFGQSSAF